MTRRGRPPFVYVVDAGPFPGPGSRGGRADGARPLFPDEGEYVRAVAALAGLGPGGPAGAGVPDEVFLHLYAYEVLERLRAAAGEGGAEPGGDGPVVLAFPFWPACLFEAAGLAVHGALEIQALFPRAERTVLVERSPEAAAREAVRVLGALRFDPERYCAAVRAAAERLGWERAEPGGGRGG